MRDERWVVSTCLKPMRFFLAVLLCATAACMRAEGRLPEVPVVRAQKSGAYIEDWLLVGPFDLEEGENALMADLLARGGKGEERTGVAEFLEYASSLPAFSEGSSPEAACWHRIAGKAFLDFQGIFGRQTLAEEDSSPAALYAAVQIEADDEHEACLVFGSDDRSKIWLNGAPLHENTRRRGVEFDDLVRLKLRKGRNFLLVKVTSTGLDWGMVARLMPDCNMAREWALAEGATTFANTAICAQRPLSFYHVPRPFGEPLPVRLKGEDGAVLTALVGGGDKSWVPAPGVRSQFYEASFSWGKNVFVRELFVGDVRAYFDVVKKRIDARTLSEEQRLHVAALGRRLEIVMGAQAAKVQSRNWQAQLCLVLRSLRRIADDLDAGREPFRGKTGMHLRAFRSAIDGNVEHYRVFVPEHVQDSGPMPLVIVLPALMSVSKPFIESPFLAAQDEADWLAAQAEKLGLAVLWPGYRGFPFGHPGEFAHLNEVLAAVGRDYSVDARRATMMSACSGAMLAGMTAVRWPKRFAAIGVINPIFHRKYDRLDDSADWCARNPLFEEWLRDNDPTKTLSRLDLPLRIIHDGAEPGHGSLDNSLEMIEAAREGGLPVVFAQMQKTKGSHKEAWLDLLAWLSKQSRAHASDEPDRTFFLNESRCGPINRVLAEPFVVAVGSEGGASEKLALQKAFAEFETAWRSFNHGPAPSAADAPELLRRDIHLVLIGNAATNRIWRELVPTLSEQQAELMRKSGAGGFQLVAPHPFFPRRRILFIGAENLEQMHIGLWNLARDGWYDWALFSGNQAERPAEVGKFQ
jgi:hypothetical protein